MLEVDNVGALTRQSLYLVVLIKVVNDEKNLLEFVFHIFVGCGDKREGSFGGSGHSFDPDHVDTLKASDYFSHIDGHVLRDSIFPYNILGSQEFPISISWSLRIMLISLGVNVEYVVFDKEGDFSRPLGRSVGDREHLGGTTVCSSPTIVFCMSWTIRNIFVIP